MPFVEAKSTSKKLALMRGFLEKCGMDLDDLLNRYFGTSIPSEASLAVQEAGIDRLRVDFGLETDSPKRFALWALLYMLGHAPDLDVAFAEELDRDAARTFMGLLAQGSE